MYDTEYALSQKVDFMWESKQELIGHSKGSINIKMFYLQCSSDISKIVLLLKLVMLPAVALACLN